MKRIGIVFGLILCLLSVGITGCKKRTSVQVPTGTPAADTQKEPDSVTETVTQPPAATPNPYLYEEDSLRTLSEEFTQKILDGKIEELYGCLTEDNQQSLSEKKLKEAYEKIVEPLGAYIGIKSVECQKAADAIYIMTLLEYENNGLLITYGFTPEIQLSTLYFSYQPISQLNKENENFTEKEITIGSTELKMDGILTLPKNVVNPPVIIMIQGSGQHDMDETIGAAGNKPFRDLAYGLAENGYASIRYNKRYYQYSEQASDSVTVDDEILSDAADAISYAAQCGLVNKDKIYVLGHSLGGMLAPKIAADNGQVAGIIVMAGSPRRLEDIIYDQTEALAAADDKTTEKEKEAYLQTVKDGVNQIKNLKKEDMNTPILGIMGCYWKSLNEIDFIEILKNLSIPMLFLQGDADFQINPEKDFGAYKQLLLGNEKAYFIEYPDLNHLFMKTNGISGNEDYDTKGAVSREVIKDIADWLDALVE